LQGTLLYKVSSPEVAETGRMKMWDLKMSAQVVGDEKVRHELAEPEIARYKMQDRKLQDQDVILLATERL